MVRRIPLTKGKTALVDDEDYEKLSKVRWFAFVRSGTSYAARHNGRPVVYMHREIVGAEPGTEVDHINGDGLDNRRANLRRCTHSQQQMHSLRRKRGRTGYRGVEYAAHVNKKNPYLVRVMVSLKVVHTSYHATAEEAARMYDAVARRVHGEFAVLNFPAHQ